MNGDVEAEAPRPRPLSGGLWTLFSWLRRDDRASSSDSLSSAGSDRTAASFAYLAPARYPAEAPPLVLPPCGPPTDSYKKRVLDRNLRRQHDRDITLHRKYGLYRSEGGTGYDNFSLPQARRPACDSIRRWERERRAASESIEGRVVHVPGKRRAPLPPVRASSTGPSTTLPRRPTKRPAPQPPIKLTQETKANISLNYRDIQVQMNTHSVRDEPPSQNNDVSMGCKSEKYSKKDSNSKNVKTRSEKNFLKQIFDNRKRNSAIETTSVRILPSISELDKEAAELIENNKLKKAREQNCNVKKAIDNEHKQSELNQSIGPSKEESWICTTCLRKYDGSVAACLSCVHEQKSTSAVLLKPYGNKNLTSASENYTQTENCSTKPSSIRNHVAEEKQKLKEMLKEMKDSLPKKPKHDHNDLVHTKNSVPLTEKRDTNTTVETPTLRIGSIVLSDNKIIKPSCSRVGTNELLEMNKCVLVTQHVVIEHAANIKENVKLDKLYVQNPVESTPMNNNSQNKSIHENAKENLKSGESKISNPFEMTSTQKRNLNTPLKISSLLNPVYIPKNKIISEKAIDALPQNEVKHSDSLLNTTGKSAILIRTSGNNSPSTAYQSRSIINVGAGVSLALEENKLKDQTVKEIKTQNEDLTAAIIKSKHSSSMEDVKLKEKVSRVTITQKENLTSNDTKDSSEIKDDKEKTKQVTKTHIEKVTSQSGTKDISEIREVKLKEITMQGEKPISPKINLAVNKPLDCLSKDKKESGMFLPTSSVEYNSTANVEKVNQHTRRRELINQLEKSIAKGDENAAAEAAVKLAQLRLSCSVLSFSSQIVSEPSTSSSNCQKNSTTQPENIHVVNASSNKIKCKNNQPVQSSPLSKPNANGNLVLSTEKSTQLGLAINIKPISTVKEITPTTCGLKPEAVNNNKCGGDKRVSPQSSPEASTSKQKENDKISIGVWVEDKEATRGPIQLVIEQQAVMGELRRQAEMALGLPTRLQRWIIGRTLCTDDSTPLVSLAGPQLNAPFYLCVVESETNVKSLNRVHEAAATSSQKREEDKAVNFYTELVQLEQQALVPNTEVFECGVCMEECVSGGGVILRECAVHTFCRDCLADVIRHSEEPIVSCPATGCKSALQEREIRALVSPVEYERWLARGLTAAESGTRNAFHCRTRDCTGWALCEPGVQRFPCPVCKQNNCVPCQAIHEGDTCEQYRVKLEAVSNVDSTQVDDSTRALLNTLIKKGEALECPECKAIITKKWGCDWVKCSACKTEICWVTRGRRWGPAGRGDTSAGCRCGVDGKRCHPSCGYCH